MANDVSALVYNSKYYNRLDLTSVASDNHLCPWASLADLIGHGVVILWPPITHENPLGKTALASSEHNPPPPPTPYLQRLDTKALENVPPRCPYAGFRTRQRAAPTKANKKRSVETPNADLWMTECR